MKKQYIVEVGFHNASIGRKVKGDIIDESSQAIKLHKEGYLKRYKTKVVELKPESIEKEKPKKVVKKSC